MKTTTHDFQNSFQKFRKKVKVRNLTRFVGWTCCDECHNAGAAGGDADGESTDAGLLFQLRAHDAPAGRRVSAASVGGFSRPVRCCWPRRRSWAAL